MTNNCQRVYCIQGGASTQFSAVPLNLVGPEDTIDHIVTGSWSKKAIAEAEKFCVANLTAKVRAARCKSRRSPLLDPACHHTLTVAADCPA